MRQNEKTTRQNLVTNLKTIHPANIVGGLWLIRDFALNEFHGGTDPEEKNEHPIFRGAAAQWDLCSSNASALGEARRFHLILRDYTQLLATLAAYLSEHAMTAAQAEITRIQSALSEGSPIGWRQWFESVPAAVTTPQEAKVIEFLNSNPALLDQAAAVYDEVRLSENRPDLAFLSDSGAASRVIVEFFAERMDLVDAPGAPARMSESYLPAFCASFCSSTPTAVERAFTEP
jgi:hypothetical protein